jgi:DNA-directed RNA polymerase specialized sigma24 family protein
MGKREVRLDAVAETAVKLFLVDNLSYGKIAKQLNITKAEAKSKVRAGLSCTPQMARQTQKVSK